MAGTCACGNEPSGSIKCGEFLDWLRTDYLFKKDSAPWSKEVFKYTVGILIVLYLLVAKVRTRLKKIIRFQNSRPRCDLEKLYAQRQRVQDTLEEKLSAIECESGNAEVQWKNIKECALDTISDLVGKVEKRASKPWITQEMIVKWLSKGNGRMSTLKKVGGTTGD